MHLLGCLEAALILDPLSQLERFRPDARVAALQCTSARLRAAGQGQQLPADALSWLCRPGWAAAHLALARQCCAHAWAPSDGHACQCWTLPAPSRCPVRPHAGMHEEHFMRQLHAPLQHPPLYSFASGAVDLSRMTASWAASMGNEIYHGQPCLRQCTRCTDHGAMHRHASCPVIGPACSPPNAARDAPPAPSEPPRAPCHPPPEAIIPGPVSQAQAAQPRDGGGRPGRPGVRALWRAQGQGLQAQPAAPGGGEASAALWRQCRCRASGATGPPIASPFTPAGPLALGIRAQLSRSHPVATPN